MGAPRVPRHEKYGAHRYFGCIRRSVAWWPTQPMKRTLRSARTLALLGAILAVCAGAAPVGAAETADLAEQWDPTPWVAFASGLVMATLVAADAKADRRGR